MIFTLIKIFLYPEQDRHAACGTQHRSRGEEGKPAVDRAGDGVHGRRRRRGGRWQGGEPLRHRPAAGSAKERFNTLLDLSLLDRFQRRKDHKI